MFLVLLLFYILVLLHSVKYNVALFVEEMPYIILGLPALSWARLQMYVFRIFHI